MITLERPNHPMARLETVRPALVAMEPAFLVAGTGGHDSDAEPSLHELSQVSPLPCAGCGGVHRDRLVRFFEVRLSDPATSGGLRADLSLSGRLARPGESRGPASPEYA